MTAQQTYPCLHCDEPSPKENDFCCLGCKTVYHLLKEYKLDQFYHIKANSTPFFKAKPVESSKHQYHYLDDPETIETYGQSDGQSITFFIEGIHCHACIWLIEKLPDIVDGIDESQVDISQNTVRITKKEQGSFASAAQTLDRLGYKLHLNDHDTKQSVQEANSKASLTRLGIAAACSANIMIFSIAIYAGLDGTLKTVFEWLSAVLMIPILGYCSAPFFKSAYSSIKMAHMNIDIPIALALSLGSIMSISNLILGHGETYFDSLAMFVFLVLSVRHIFLTSYQNLDYQSALSSSIIVHESQKIVGNTIVTVPTKSLNPGDIIQVASGNTIPVDGTMNTNGHIDVHILTGESDPIKKTPGDDILAGMKNIGNAITVVVEKTGKDTRLGSLIQQIQSTEKPQLVLIADRVAHWFLLITISLAVGIFLWHGYIGMDIHTGLQSALALIVLACPCALSLATPLAYALSMTSASTNGICIQSSSALENLTHIKTIFFDKTGTLTKGQLEVNQLIQYIKNDSIIDLLYSLEESSKHPIASAIRRYCLSQKKTIQALALDTIDEKIGTGIFAQNQNKHYKLIGSSKSLDTVGTAVALYENDQLMAEIFLDDQLVDEAASVINTLKQKGYSIGILSGDQAPYVKKVQTQLGIDTAHWQLSPEDKVTFVKNTPNVLMIGDGANDSQAMLNADVSIAVQGSFESSLRASDIYFISKNLLNITTVLALANKTKRVILGNFILSLSYNTLGIILVMLGYIHPLIAAILMPISSLTVITYSWIKLKR